MIDVQRIDFIARPVADVARASEFYGETLGLARNTSSDEHWAEYETGNLTIALSEHGGLGLGVPDVEEARRTLEGPASSSRARSTTPGSASRAASAILPATSSSCTSATHRSSVGTGR